jgi:predicted PurR-regulated permease PerM
VLALIGAISAVTGAVAIPASQWIQKAPQTIPIIKEKIAVLHRPIDYLQDELRELEAAAISAHPDMVPQEQAVPKSYSPVFGNLASSTAIVLARFFTAMVLLFFLLSFGDRLLRAFVEILPRFSEKRQTVEIAKEIEHSITKYLVIVTMMNAAVGLATGVLMWAFGFADPMLWGTAAFLLNYIPILGPLVGVLLFFAAGLLTFDSPWYAIFPAGGYLLIHVVEGENVTPMLLASRLTLNPILVILSVLSWYALWGVPGALLAVPLLAIFKIFCDRIDSLKPIGHLIGS